MQWPAARFGDMIFRMFRSIDISDLPQPLIEAIETIVRSYRDRSPETQNERRPIGWAKDSLPELPASFFDALPAEICPVPTLS